VFECEETVKHEEMSLDQPIWHPVDEKPLLSIDCDSSYTINCGLLADESVYRCGKAFQHDLSSKKDES
jgi:hypothetical protein